MRAEKIAISVPSDLLKEVEAFRKPLGESRSATVQRALRLLLKERERARKVRQYIEGYRRSPETEAEIQEGWASLERLIAEEPWE